MSQSNNKLLSINTYHYRRGGADAVYLDHTEMFQEHGWETAYFAMHHPKNESSPWSKYFIDEIEMGHDYSFWRKMKMAGKVIYSFEAREKISRLISNWTPSIAHAHLIYHHISPSILGLLKDAGIATVMTAHDLKLTCPAYKMMNSKGVCEKCKNGNLLHLISNRCIHGSLPLSSLIAIESTVHRVLKLYRNNLDCIVTPSRFYKQKFMEWGWPEEKLVYVPNFIPLEQYEPHCQPGDYYLYFGRLNKEKGLDTLIRAAAESGISLRLAGTGPEEAKLKALAESLSADIEFLGYCSGDLLWRTIRESRAVILPSQWYENAPMSVIEAYACGKIVLGADIGGIPELVFAGETGFLFESGNVEDCAKAIRECEKLPSARIEEMGHKAREYVLANHTKESYFPRMESLYKKLIH